MITWEFYSKRRKISLESFLKDTGSYESALEYFKTREISPPADLKSFYDSPTPQKPENKEKSLPTPEEQQATPTRKKASRAPRKKPATQTRKRRSSTVKKSKTVEEAKSEKSPEAAETKDEKKQYFRKIIKTEKK